MLAVRRKSVEKRHFGKRAVQAAVVLCFLCICLLIGLGNRAQEGTPLSAGFGDQAQEDTPPQDADGYFLLSTEEDFRWFTQTAREEDPAVNVRLAADIVLNDTDGWENWDKDEPKRAYLPIIHYQGHFDGNGHAMVGYNSRNRDDGWFASVFTILDEGAEITNLTIRESVFRTTLADCGYEDNDGRADVVTASALCYTNYGVIENCEVEAKVIGAWDAGGIVSENYGRMEHCRFTGTVEAGMETSEELPEAPLAVHSLFAGGVCRSNQGVIRNCENTGRVTLHTLPDAWYIHSYAAGGLAGHVSAGGIIEDSENNGDVTSVQLSGGVAGANWGEIRQCTNNGHIHVEQAERDYTESLISAGICASNGGFIDTCLNTGEVTINQKYLSFYAPLYGVACNTVNPDKGTIKNCYYVQEKVSQDYRLSGVHKLSAAEQTDFAAYLSGQKKKETGYVAGICPYYENEEGDSDTIRLGFGPEEDTTYQVKEGDSLWRIAEKFYGDGRYYHNLEWANPELESDVLQPGMELTVIHRDFSLYRRLDEEGFGWSYCRLPSGESCPTRFVTAKPIDWYYGNMRFEANAGLDTLWPKNPFASADYTDAIHIFYRVDANPDGDFFGEDWEAAKKRIKKSAAAYCGDAIDPYCFRFDRYQLDNGESLYCYSFLLNREEDVLLCAAAYRLCDNMLAEFIGVEPIDAYYKNRHVGEGWDIWDRVPYMAAIVDTTIKIEEAQCDPETFYGRENWAYPQLHNPFALALAYDQDAECVPYVLATGAQ